MNDGLAIHRRDLHGGVDAAGGGAADEQRDFKIFALHFLGDVGHFFERRSDQAAQADHVSVAFAGCGKNFVSGNHHAKVDHFIIVAAEDDADDIFANVVNIAFYRGQENSALGLSPAIGALLDRKSTRLNSSHPSISYAVFCLKKKKIK